MTSVLIARYSVFASSSAVFFASSFLASARLKSCFTFASSGQSD
jgi:hypothetical protein